MQQVVKAVVYWGGVYAVYQPPGFFGQRILTSVIINKQGTFGPSATPPCVYPPPFLAIHHWVKQLMTRANKAQKSTYSDPKTTS